MIKSKITNIESSKYPYIGEILSADKKSKLVLFTSKETGICIYNDTGDGTDVGSYIHYWDEDDFKKYKGSITLEND